MRCRSCSRWATPRATGATSWRTSRSPTPRWRRYVNAHFVAIKVDREERPDVDAVYMEATQAMTGQGGWPMTCFLTPDGDPFHCGTYYPASPHGGMPSFTQLLGAVVRAWSEEGERVRDAARAITQRLASVSRSLPPRRRRRRHPRRGRRGPDRRLRRAARRVRGRAEVPAVGGAGVPAAPPRAHGQLRRARDDRHHRRGDGPRRAVRPARGRVRPLLGRRDVDRAALREDALRQRPAAARLRAPGPADGVPRPPPASPT